MAELNTNLEALERLRESSRLQLAATDDAERFEALIRAHDSGDREQFQGLLPWGTQIPSEVVCLDLCRTICVIRCDGRVISAALGGVVAQGDTVPVGLMRSVMRMAASVWADEQNLHAFIEADKSGAVAAREFILDLAKGATPAVATIAHLLLCRGLLEISCEDHCKTVCLGLPVVPRTSS